MKVVIKHSGMSEKQWRALDKEERQRDHEALWCRDANGQPWPEHTAGHFADKPTPAATRDEDGNITGGRDTLAGLYGGSSF